MNNEYFSIGFAIIVFLIVIFLTINGNKKEEELQLCEEISQEEYSKGYDNGFELGQEEGLSDALEETYIESSSWEGAMKKAIMMDTTKVMMRDVAPLIVFSF